MSGAILPLPQHAFMAWYLVKKGTETTFTFTFTFTIMRMFYGFCGKEAQKHCNCLMTTLA